MDTRKHRLAKKLQRHCTPQAKEPKSPSFLAVSSSRTIARDFSQSGSKSIALIVSPQRKVEEAHA
jgi:hypothetical protein